MRLAHDIQGSGPTIVLLHGFPLDRTIWKPLARSLADRYRVITPDLRGLGESDAPAGVHSMEAMAEDVFETLDGLGVEGPVIVGGFSMGGYVALAMVASRPERLRGLMMVASRASADSPSVAEARQQLASLVESIGSVDPVVDQMLPKLFAPITSEQRPELVAEWARRMRSTPVSGVVGALRGMAVRADRTALLKSIEVPALVLAGTDDPIITLDESRSTARHLRNAKLVVIPDAGHMLMVERIDSTNQAIGGFLDEFR